jgi:hypothetical protein
MKMTRKKLNSLINRAKNWASTTQNPFSLYTPPPFSHEIGFGGFKDWRFSIFLLI